MAFHVKIRSTGSYTPSRILSNEDIAKKVNTDPQWIYNTLGIKNRRIAKKEEKTSDMAYHAAKNALKNAGMKIEDIDMIIVATSTPDRLAPSTAAILQGKLGATKAPAFDISAVCSGYIYAQNIVSAMIHSGFILNALIVGAEKYSTITDWDKRESIFFGDGAGAAILEKSDGKSAILNQNLYADGSGWENFTIPGGGSEYPCSKNVLENKLNTFRMNGRAVYDTGTDVLPKAIAKSLKDIKMNPSDIDHVLPHQPSWGVLKKISEKTNIPWEKFHTNMENYANTAGATIPLVMDETNQKKLIKRGDIVLMIAVGSGWTWGVAILRW